MSAKALLDKQRTAIFESKLEFISNYAKKHYGHLSFFEELKQTMLLEYAIALSKADLTQNYEAFCWRAMKWSGNMYLNKAIKTELRTESSNDFQNEKMVSEIETCSSGLNQGILIDRLCHAFEKLTQSEQHIVEREFDSIRVKCDLGFSYDKRKRIARKFKNSVLSVLEKI